MRQDVEVPSAFSEVLGIHCDKVFVVGPAGEQAGAVGCGRTHLHLLRLDYLPHSFAARISDASSLGDSDSARVFGSIPRLAITCAAASAES